MYPARLLNAEHFCGIHSPLLRIKLSVSEASFNNDEMYKRILVSIRHFGL